jgi:phytanoyl-CoA hydroxylase
MANPAALHNQFQRDGYIVARELFPREDTAAYCAHYMQLNQPGAHPNELVNQWDDGAPDPLRQYPRLMNMHHWDDLSRQWLLDDRLRQYLTTILGREPYAIQTMIYFKPPGSRGQALHQDQYYLRAHPGTSIAAWMALEEIDVANGCLQLVPGTQDIPLICPVAADATASFTNIAVPLPAELNPVPIELSPGDVLFFNGQLVHGSFPNTTADRFRRALVGHYIEGHARRVAAFDHPVLRMDGTVATEVGNSPNGGKCGDWVDRDGAQLVDVKQVFQSGTLDTTAIP